MKSPAKCRAFYRGAVPLRIADLDPTNGRAGYIEPLIPAPMIPDTVTRARHLNLDRLMREHFCGEGTIDVRPRTPATDCARKNLEELVRKLQRWLSRQEAQS